MTSQVCNNWSLVNKIFSEKFVVAVSAEGCLLLDGYTLPEMIPKTTILCRLKPAIPS